jgi:competence protein ComEA
VEKKIWQYVAIGGIILLLSGGIWFYQHQEKVEVEIIKSEKSEILGIWVDVQGAVEKPGVYKIEGDTRVKDALMAAGGLSDKADRSWVARYVNLAEEVKDGVKIYIPEKGDPTSPSASLGASTELKININAASVGELDKLEGIGATRAQAIIDGRPYGKVEDLLEKSIIPKSVFEKIKQQISVF